MEFGTRICNMPSTYTQGSTQNGCTCVTVTSGSLKIRKQKKSWPCLLSLWWNQTLLCSVFIPQLPIVHKNFRKLSVIYLLKWFPLKVNSGFHLSFCKSPYPLSSILQLHCIFFSFCRKESLTHLNLFLIN